MHVSVPLAFIASLYMLFCIMLHGGPVIPRSQSFSGEGSSAQMLVVYRFIDLEQDVIRFASVDAFEEGNGKHFPVQSSFDQDVGVLGIWCFFLSFLFSQYLIFFLFSFFSIQDSFFKKNASQTAHYGYAAGFHHDSMDQTSGPGVSLTHIHNSMDLQAPLSFHTDDIHIQKSMISTRYKYQVQC